MVYQMLNWKAPSAIQAQGKELARKVKDLSLLIQPPAEPSVWEQCAAILSEKTDTDVYKRQDDALALVISKVTRWRLSFAYLFTDLTVLLLSLSYIPITRIAFSLVTVTLSSFLIDKVTAFQLPRSKQCGEGV